MVGEAEKHGAGSCPIGPYDARLRQRQKRYAHQGWRGAIRTDAQGVTAHVDAVERRPIRYLEARLDSAVLVVEGEVESIGPSPVPDGFTLRSPNYQLAVVRVVSTLKGEHRERVNVLFPTNPAPLWRTAPRFREDENAIFILRHETALQAPPEFLTALDPSDVHSREALNQIKSLLKQ